jgi:homoserine dehydrogenase
MQKPLTIGLLGCGTVGTGVATLLLRDAARLAQRAGRPLYLKGIVVRDRSKRRGAVPPELLTPNADALLNDPAVDVIVELIGGTTLAKDYILRALQAGKDVVTANKALLAEAGAEVFEAARNAERTICFEGAVAGGVPIIRALAESLSANQVTAIQAILNGTSNYILSAMADQGMSYAEALKDAQRLGYAEADPTLDVDGSDAAHKLAILAQIAFGVDARPEEIERLGIEQVDRLDMQFATNLGYTIKLLAEAWVADRSVALHVAPVMVRRTDMLAQVRSAFNAIQLIGDVVGETLYQGPGAGMMPTASAVVADLIDLAIGRAQRTFSVAKLWSERGTGFVVERSEKVQSRFYLRVMVNDKPGVLAEVCRLLAEENISISSLVQPEVAEGNSAQTVPLVIMTHYAETGRFRRAVQKMAQLPNLRTPPVTYSVDD